jgi:Kef-type K+ transport system membrane component KefB
MMNLMEDPNIKFTILIFLILGTPYLFRKIKIPHIVGYIIAGSLIGPFGIQLLAEANIVLYKTVGLLYIMFIAGLEIDIADFKKNSHKSFLFGMLTFLIPITAGLLAGTFLLQDYFTKPDTIGSLLPAIVLFSSIFASHTLVTYPIIGKYGIKKNKAVNITIGGTMITNILALFILAIVVGVVSEGELTPKFWIQLIVLFSAVTFIIIYLLPMLARRFLKWETDNIAQYLFVLGMVFVAGSLALLCGMEAIIGAFLAGLALNQLVPETSPLKNRIDFIGNALFIPIFLIGVGMMINFRVIFTSLHTIFIATVMIAVAMGSKYLAAFFTQKILKYSVDERNIIFGLSNSQAAATLAVVLVGQRIGIFPDDLQADGTYVNRILDGSVMMILVTCLISSIFTDKGAKNISLLDEPVKDIADEPDTERILIPISHPDTIEDLMNLGLTIKDKKHKDNIYAVNIISSSQNNPDQEKRSKELLERASQIVTATDQQLHEVIRYDVNISNGIYNVVKEHKITDIIVGLHKKSSLTDSFLGQLTEGILSQCDANTLIYHSVQPLNTVKRMVVVIPENAEKESNFNDFIVKIWNLATNGGAKFIVFASETVIKIFQGYKEINNIELETIDFTDWEDFLIVSSKVDHNTALMIFMARPGSISRNEEMGKISKYLNRYFSKNNYILYYPTLHVYQPATALKKDKKAKKGK